MEDKTFIGVAELIGSMQEKIDQYEAFEIQIVQWLINKDYVALFKTGKLIIKKSLRKRLVN